MKELTFQEIVDIVDNTKEDHLTFFVRNNTSQDWTPLIIYGLGNKNKVSYLPIYDICKKYLIWAIEVEVDESEKDNIIGTIAILRESHNKLIEYIKQLERKLK